MRGLLALGPAIAMVGVGGAPADVAAQGLPAMVASKPTVDPTAEPFTPVPDAVSEARREPHRADDRREPSEPELGEPSPSEGVLPPDEAPSDGERDRSEASGLASPLPSASSLRAVARAHFLEGRYDQAARMYAVAVRLDPQHPAAYAGLGSAHLARGEIEQARRAYVRSLRRDSANSRVWTYYARSLSRAGTHDRARRALEEALALDPENEAAREDLAALVKEEHVVRSEPTRAEASVLLEVLGGVVGEAVPVIPSVICMATQSSCQVSTFATMVTLPLSLTTGIWLAGRAAGGNGGFGWVLLGQALGSALAAATSVGTLMTGALHFDAWMGVVLATSIVFPIGGGVIAFEASNDIATGHAP